MFRWFGFIFLYTGALLLESWLSDPQTHISYVVFSVGLIIGAMHISHARQWPVLLVTAALLQCLWLVVMSPALGIGSAALYSVGTILLAAFCGSTPSWLLPGDRREMRPNEIFLGCLVTTVIAGVAFIFVRRMINPLAPSLGVRDFVTCLSFLLGTAAVAPPVVVFGLAYGRPRQYGITRVVVIIVAVTTLVVTGGLVLRQYPAWVYSLLAPHHYIWIWITIFAGIITAVRASAVTTTTALLIMTAVSVFAFRHSAMGTTDETALRLGALAEVQITDLGVIVIVLSITALVSGRRKESELKHIRENIAKEILKANQHHSSAANPSPEDGLTQALGAAAEYCDADECRLYLASSDNDRFSIEYRWHSATVAAPVGGAPGDVSVAEAPNIIDKIQRRDATLLRIAVEGRNEIEREALVAFGLPPGVAVLCQPLTADGTVFAFAVMINFSGAPISRRDARPLMQSIGEFYGGLRARELTQKSLQEYEERLRHLATRFAHAEESVRRRTAVELHDGLIQRLAVARMKLGELRTRRNSASDIASEVIHIVDEALTESRAIIHSLSPSVLYELGLVPGLQSLSEELSAERGFDIEIRQHGQPCTLTEALQVCIYHVVQELINNSIVHSGGHKIWVDLFWEQSSLDAVVVSDDGKFSNWWLEAESQKGSAALGLLSASERLRPFGFNIKFEQRRRGGTRAIVYWAAT